MILLFPTLDTLRLVLTSSVLPPALSLTPVRAGFDGQGRTWVEPSAPLPRSIIADLGKLGVQPVKTAAVAVDESLSCWPQLLPVERDSTANRPADKTPILFELLAEQLAEVVGEILRLGNDRQSFRAFADDETGRVLLRVIGPPYYSLLRALDRSGANAPRAYVEASPRVWCELGTTHPLVDQLQPPAGKLLLLRPPRCWMQLDDGPFRDIYEVLEFTVPAGAAAWQPADLPAKLTVPLSLARSSSNDPAELWVLREQGLQQLDALVREADDHLLARLAFAVAVKDGQTMLVLRVRPSRLAPPVLVLDGVACRPILKLPNLFLPCDSRLHPPLRRDAVARLLAGDNTRVTWLLPDGTGGFVPESLPDDAFRPLEQWVDFILQHEHRALTAWVQATRFNFEPFVCKDDGPAAPTKKPERPREKARKGKDQSDGADAEQVGGSAGTLKITNKSRRRDEDDDAPLSAVRAKPSELQQALRGLEQQFLQSPTPLDTPERQDLWRQMGRVNSELAQNQDAALCWLNAVWEQDQPSAGWLNVWARAELRAINLSELDEGALDRLLSEPLPTSGSLRLLTAYLAWAGATGDPSSALRARLDRLQQYLEAHESSLPVRAVWVAWVSLVALAQDDVLALARARDRILDRLFQRGLSADLDLPAFLRFSGVQANDRFRSVGEQLAALHPRVRAWVGESTSASYVDLLFAYGLARLGSSTLAQKLLRAAHDALIGRDLVHTWLAQAFEFRIRQALDAKPHTGRLPDDLLERLSYLDADTADKYVKRKQREDRYKIDRLRQYSRILEPHEKVDAYRRWHGHFADELSQQLAMLGDVNDRAELAAALTTLLQSQQKAKRTDTGQARIVLTALQLSPRLGEAFARDVLGRVGPLLAGKIEPVERALLIEKALFLSAHFDQTAQVRDLAAALTELLAAQTGTTIVTTLDTLLGETFRGLRKLGMRDQIRQILQQMADVLLQGKPVVEFSQRQAAHLEAGGTIDGWLTTLKALLQVAGSWYFFGQDDLARPVLDAVRILLLHGDFIPVHQTDLACAYVTVLGQAPLEFATARLDELFRKIERIQDTFTTNSHYSLSKLKLVESLVLSLVSDESGLYKAGRRWLDDDEFLVRRRIHRDVRTALGRAGL